MSFTHLHLHTEYSLLDGACRIRDLVARIKDLGQTSVAITDHGVMYGAIDFYKACKSEGIKPIIGCEVYTAKRTRFDRDAIDKKSGHLILLAKNNEGYHNLIKIVSGAFKDGFYYKPRVDHELLEKYNVEKAFYGHLHGKDVWPKGLKGVLNGISYDLVSLDYLKGIPQEIV